MPVAIVPVHLAGLQDAMPSTAGASSRRLARHGTSMLGPPLRERRSRRHPDGLDQADSTRSGPTRPRLRSPAPPAGRGRPPPGHFATELWEVNNCRDVPAILIAWALRYPTESSGAGLQPAAGPAGDDFPLAILDDRAFPSRPTPRIGPPHLPHPGHVPEFAGRGWYPRQESNLRPAP